MTPGRFKLQLMVAELVPVLIALPFATGVYFASVPNAQQAVKPALLLIAVLFAITRIPNEIYKTSRLLPPILGYLAALRDGRTISQTQLANVYIFAGNFVLRAQLMAAANWFGSSILCLIGFWIWIQRGLMAMVTLGFAAVVAATVSMSFSYFFFKRLIRPILEEIAGVLKTTPKGKVFRVTLRAKLGVSVVGLTILGFLAFGLVMWVTARSSFAKYAIEVNEDVAGNLAVHLDNPERSGEVDGLLASYSNPTRTFALCSAEGTPLSPVNAGVVDASVAFAVRSSAASPEKTLIMDTGRGPIALHRVRDGQAFLILIPNPEQTAAGVGAILRQILLFLPFIIVLVGGFVTWLAWDTARVVRLAAIYNKRLAEGDLSELPALWSDDELGEMAESMRTTFQGLGRMTREIQHAGVVVDEEVARVTSVAQSLSREVGHQSQQVQATATSLGAAEGSMTHISGAMEQIALATQEVSSTILQMQASVEEIAGNAEILTQSVEKTVSSSNEIAASAEEITGSTDQLHQNSQEAVSFLTELDAALEETRRNAKALSENATHVTGDAEKGFNTVAAVEEEILRMRKASEQNQDAMGALSASIERIGKIVDVIQDITEQTNLLSLNASIIAAGAGEYGKSFSVVATQIRELSARTSGNAKEIRDMIRSIREGGTQISTSMGRVYELVDKTFTLSRDAGENLRKILESASGQEEMSKRIAIATDELAHGGQSANRTMQRIFGMIEGITKASQEQARSTRYLNEESERVREVALQLKNATDEQAKGARVISEAVNRITEDSQATSMTVQSQAGEIRSVAESVRHLEDATRSIQQAFHQLTQASTRLQQSAATLSHEIRAFRVSAE